MDRMGNSRLWGKITILIAVCGWGLSAQAKYDGGCGEPNNPYQISSVADWQELMATPADWASHFVLTADIDLNDVPITPVGNDADSFTGVFDGNDFAIRNVYVNMPGSYYFGLFGWLGSSGQIKNLGVEDATISGEDCVGGLVGVNEGSISNSYSSGSVGGAHYVGGLVGWNNGTISNSYSTGSVTGTDSYIGGLVGMNWGGTIINSYSSGSVGGAHYVGGLVGSNEGTIIQCYSTGDVVGEDIVGGLVGDNSNWGAIENCYAKGSVTGGEAVGGLVGRNLQIVYEDIARYPMYGTINCTYSTSRVAGAGTLGGLVGVNYGCWEICEETCEWWCEEFCESPECAPYCCWTDCWCEPRIYCWGEECGTGDLAGSFWDTDTSDVNQMCGDITGQGSCDDGQGKTTVEMQQQSTYAGWDFQSTWRICEGTEYPILRWQIERADFACPTGVSLVEFAVIGKAWQSTPADGNWDPNCNLRADSIIDLLDVAVFFDLWMVAEMTVAVPDVVDMNQVDAHAALIAAGLAPGDETFIYSEAIPRLNIISQDPAPGTVVEEYSQVRLVISDGPCPKVAVPDLADMNEVEAESAIVAAGLVVGSRTYEPNDLVAEGGIIRQNPAAGAMICTGSEVDIVVSEAFPSDLVRIPAGEFQMGDSLGEGEGNELPVHRVQLNAFAMSRFEVTNKQYADFLNSAYSQGSIEVTNGSVYSGGSTYVYCETTGASQYTRISWDQGTETFGVTAGRHEHPVVRVSWYGAAAYCNWRSRQEDYETCYDTSTLTCDFSKHGYRLPTEAEWEYAGRGGLAGKRYPWGDNAVPAQSNFYESGDPYEVEDYPQTTPGGFYNGDIHYGRVFGWPGAQANYQTSDGSNGYGLYDILGNAWEWCNDTYDADYYSTRPDPDINPQGPGGDGRRVIRGSGWGTSYDETARRIAFRHHAVPTTMDASTGFRVVLVSP